MTKSPIKTLLLLLFGGAIALTPQEAFSQRGKKSKKNKRTESTSPPKRGGKDDPKPLQDLTKDAVASEGLFTLYSDTTSGASWMAIPDSMLQKQFIYFSHIEDGVAESGYTRGSYRNSKVISFHKHYNRIEIHAENTNYYFDPESPLARANQANINTPIIASLSIQGIDSSKTTYAVSNADLFLKEGLEMVKRPSRKPGESVLGKLSREKSKIFDINNYPENTEVTVD
jgi:hypothetical protein